MRAIRSLVACFAVVVVAGCGGGNEANSEARVPSAESFIEILREFEGDYEPSSSPAALADVASLTVVGEFTSIVDGRVFGTSADSGPMRLTVLAEFRVERVVRTSQAVEAGDLIYVELPRTPEQTVDSFDAAGVGLRAMLFLDDFTAGYSEFLLESPEALRDGQTVFAPYSEGLLVEGPNGDVLSGKVGYPHLWPKVSTIDELVVETERSPLAE